MGGNMMVVVVILHSRKLRRTITNKFICNQSLLDFSASFFIAFTAFFRESGHIPPGILRELFCRLWLTNWPLWGVFVSSTYNLVALTFERYFAILYPLRHSQRFTKRKAYVIMGMVWIIGPSFLGAYGISSSTVKDGTCTVYSEWPNQVTRQVVAIITVFVQYFIPLCSITYAYIRIFFALRKSSDGTRNGSSTVNDKREERMAKAKKNVVKTLAQVFACFVFCWSWNQIFYTLFNFGVLLDFDSDFYNFTVLCVFLNSCMNPFVYSMNYDQFKKAQRSLFCSCCSGVTQRRSSSIMESDTNSQSQEPPYEDRSRSTTTTSCSTTCCFNRDADEEHTFRYCEKSVSVCTITTNNKTDDEIPNKNVSFYPANMATVELQAGNLDNQLKVPHGHVVTDGHNTNIDLTPSNHGHGVDTMSEDEEEKKGISTRL